MFLFLNKQLWDRHPSIRKALDMLSVAGFAVNAALLLLNDIDLYGMYSYVGIVDENKVDERFAEMIRLAFNSHMK